MIKQLLTIKEVAGILKVRKNAVYQYIKDGKLLAHRLGSNGKNKQRHFRVKEEDLQRFIDPFNTENSTK